MVNMTKLRLEREAMIEMKKGELQKLEENVIVLLQID